LTEILTQSELRFLASQGLSADDVFDARRLPQAYWFKRIDETNKTVALGSKCRSAGHRLRSRRGHCVQCDTSKLGYQARYRADQYVYIAGSRSAKLIKIGTCSDLDQRERQVRAERYGSEGDWRFIFHMEVSRAGEIENLAQSRLSRYCLIRPYWKNGSMRDSIELLQCSFSRARTTLMEVAESAKLSEPWVSSNSSLYEFPDESDVG
jgi:hypothetical protein